MANEATLSINLQFSKGGKSASMRAGGLQVDVAGTKYIQNVQTIGTSAEAIDLGDIAAPGLMMVRNRNASGSINFREGASGADFVKVLAGEVATFRLAGTAPYAIGTENSEIEYLIVEN
ncbi:MAG: hypothetical protein AAGB04_00090 [Pseudomonadota bacterium]